ncbi:hypothetical protein AJ85_07665 [Alkalihalobacillus alcalophilus ATCC 27647 = CGMCC 1.3604]|uniref:Uncharacterized protein n=1 Tax=Alkalihalobacillus alcalophilus ATCC 27647 = CGMCC 1.3604 TaxID=1218173 RepID=A0A4S4K0D2_ALKAL|nr:hypothetical protein AJ85_07665 [Alkalihalobacillus alcalophilus ATCC 27647 = CGMCC 1.3604]
MLYNIKASQLFEVMMTGHLKKQLQRLRRLSFTLINNFFFPLFRKFDKIKKRKGDDEKSTCAQA